VWNVRVEGLAGKAFGGRSLLLRIDPLAVLVLGTDQYRRRRAHRSHSISGDCSVAAQHEDVVAQDLEIILSEVARVATFVVPVRHLAVCFHRKVATKTTRHPG
jgi:hypothetical protein